MDLETFINKWQGQPGGAERAVANTLTDYRFEAPVRPDAAFSDKSSGRIDLYKRRRS